jgi:hypothetical protein
MHAEALQSKVALNGENIPEAGTQLLELIRFQLDRESGLKQSLESRAIAVITASGTFVTLLLAFTAWRSQQRGPGLTYATKALIVAGVASLLLATLFGIITNVPSLTGKIEADDLLQNIEGPLWDSQARDMQRKIARAQLKVLTSAQNQNKRKARFLTLSVCAQILGLSLIAAAVLEILH